MPYPSHTLNLYIIIVARNRDKWLPTFQRDLYQSSVVIYAYISYIDFIFNCRSIQFLNIYFNLMLRQTCEVFFL